MGVEKRLYPVLMNPRYTFLLFFSIAIIPRIIVWALIPLDWNSDSYHQWQISYLTLKIGLRHGRLWDLNGCELNWGVVPHIVQTLLLGVLSTTSIAPYRVLNIVMGGVNTYLVYLIGRDNFYWKVGFYAGILFAFYPAAVIFDVIAMQETLALCLALLSVYTFRSRARVTVVFSPIFVPYYTEYTKSLLFMLRMSTPIAAFGSILLMSLLYKTKLNLFGGRLRRLPVELALVMVAIASLGYLIPSYSLFQEDTRLAFGVADMAFNHYQGGTIVCDNPTMNYRLASRWKIEAEDLLGNHYSPYYYGVSDPVRYAEWFKGNNVTLWIYTGSRSYHVWGVVSREIPDLLVLKEIINEVRVYEVDHTALEEFLAGWGNGPRSLGTSGGGYPGHLGEGDGLPDALQAADVPGEPLDAYAESGGGVGIRRRG
jgi:hypothetical protein